MTKRILVTGGQGQIGLELARLSWPADVKAYFPTRDELDLCERHSISRYFDNTDWSALINCAAYTAVDKAEDEPGLAFLANAQGPAWLADTCRKRGIPLIHVSTDYVFAGEGPGYYCEHDRTDPVGVYGSSKLSGELAVTRGNIRTVVLRTAWVVSAHRSNFLKTMLRVAANEKKLKVVADQFGCPTSAADIAAALKTIAMLHLVDTNAPTGIYHFVNAGEASWCEFARNILRLSLERGGPTAEVEAIASEDYPTTARRPANSRLSTVKIERDFGLRPRPWQEAVIEIMDELLPPSMNSEEGQK